MSPPIRLGDLLLRAGVITEAQLNAALAEQKQWGGRLGSVLVRMGALSEDLLVKALARQLNIPRAPLGPTDVIQVPAQILERIDRATCEKHIVLPVAYVPERRALQVALADPFNVVAIDDLSRRVGLRIEPLIAGETQILQAIARLFGGAPAVDPSLQSNDVSLAFVDNTGRVIAGQRPAAPSSVPPVTVPPVVTPAPLAPYGPYTPQPAAATSVPPQPPLFGGGAPAPYPPTPMQPFFTAPGLSPAPVTGVTPATVPTTAPPQAFALGVDELRALATQQLRAMQALADLLVERGIVSRAELSAWLGR